MQTLNTLITSRSGRSIVAAGLSGLIVTGLLVLAALTGCGGRPEATIQRSALVTDVSGQHPFRVTVRSPAALLDEATAASMLAQLQVVPLAQAFPTLVAGHAVIQDPGRPEQSNQGAIEVTLEALESDVDARDYAWTLRSSGSPTPSAPTKDGIGSTRQGLRWPGLWIPSMVGMPLHPPFICRYYRIKVTYKSGGGGNLFAFPYGSWAKAKPSAYWRTVSDGFMLNVPSFTSYGYFYDYSLMYQGGTLIKHSDITCF